MTRTTTTTTEQVTSAKAAARHAAAIARQTETDRSRRTVRPEIDLTRGMPNRPGSATDADYRPARTPSPVIPALHGPFLPTDTESAQTSVVVGAAAMTYPGGPMFGPFLHPTRPVRFARGPWGLAGPRDRRGNTLAGLDNALAELRTDDGAGWQVWQGSDFDASTGEPVTHKLPGGRPGTRTPRTDHVAWCTGRITVTGAAWQTGDVGRARLCRETSRGSDPYGTGDAWSCPVHGDASVVGCAMAAPIEMNAARGAPVVTQVWNFTDEPAWGPTQRTSDASARVARRITRSRKTGRSTIVTTQGESMRPEPSEPVMGDRVWTPRLRASSADGGRVLVYRLPALASPAYGHGSPWRIRTARGSVVRASAFRGSHLLAVHKADGSAYRIARKLPARAMAALIARDASVVRVESARRASLPKSVRRSRAADVSVAAATKGATTRRANSLKRLARLHTAF